MINAQDDYARQREEMVQEIIRGGGAADPRVLAAMRKVPRHEFVPQEYLAYAYDNRPLPIGERQTISQPLMVAMMTEALDIDPDSRILEIGTGSGYQTALLAELSAKVYSIERYETLATRARETLASLGYTNVEVLVADGSQGYPERSPYNRILVTAGAPTVPDLLIEQLRIGGKMVIPVGDFSYQALTLVEKTDRGASYREITGCVFVPLIGKYGWRPEETESDKR
ncbi:MAG: protein-L-isoaspartate(D-aspartate) O-methyltransferase [Armatimonadota bacterium]|nr:protein-L-isoaspartate(D-aspartate) O-methyltransferase [Armatimonadota bacterium]